MNTTPKDAVASTLTDDRATPLGQLAVNAATMRRIRPAKTSGETERVAVAAFNASL